VLFACTGELRCNADVLQPSRGSVCLRRYVSAASSRGLVNTSRASDAVLAITISVYSIVTLPTIISTKRPQLDMGDDRHVSNS